MPPELVAYIIKYGYLVIFGLVFAQEIGVPNPVPNEAILLFSGYLASVGQLKFAWVVITAVMADFIGTTLLYLVFYTFGAYLLSRNWRWLPKEKIEKLKNKLSGRGQWGIYVGRLIPYVRGYTSVAAGLLKISPWVFLPAVLLSALTWSGGYVLAGRLLGPKWDVIINRFGFGWSAFLLLAAFIVIFFVIPGLLRWAKHRPEVKK